MASMRDSNDKIGHGYTRSNFLEPENEEPHCPPLKSSDEVPNGSLKAWLQVVGSFMAFLNTWYFLPLLSLVLYLLTHLGAL